MVKVSCTIDGYDYDAMVELNSLKVLATFERGNVQPNISLSNVTLVNAAARKVIDYGTEGLNGGTGYLEGLPVLITAYDPQVFSAPITVFDGYIDFTQGYRIINSVKVSVRLVKRKSLNDLETKLSALTYGLLTSTSTELSKRITSADFTTVKTVVIPVDQTLENLMLAFLEFTMLRELYFLILKIDTDIANFVTSPITLVLDVIYAALLVIQIVKLTKKLIELLYPLPKNNLGITFHKALSKAVEYLGYSFNSSIEELKTYVYLPSKPDYTELTTGIPQAGDFGYHPSQMFEVAKKMFYAKMAVVGSTVQLHPVDSTYWKTLKTPQFDPTSRISIEDKEQIIYNIDEFIANFIISFQTDTTDEYTVKNFTGTNYEVITKPVQVRDQFNVLNKGLEEINIPLALGNTRDLLEGYEEVLLLVTKEIDKILIAFKSKITLSQLIVNRGAPLKVSSTTWNVPKVLAVKSTGYLYADQRARISARYLYDNFYYTKSFMPNNFFGQKRMFPGVVIPFGFSDFVKCLNSSYFASGKVESIEWEFSKDRATLDYWVSETWTKNIQQVFIQP